MNIKQSHGDMENNHFAPLVILMIVVLLTHINCQNYKPSYKIAAILPVLEENYKKFISIQYDTGCSKNLRDDALLTVEALYYAFDFVKKNVSQEFDLHIEVIETCGNKLTNLKDFSKLYDETQQSDSEYGGLKGVIYSDEYGPFNYGRLFQSMNLIQCSISGPLNKSFSLEESFTPWAIYSTTGHFFILDIIFQIVDRQNWKHVLFMDPYDLNDEKFNGKHLLERVQKLAKRYDICLTSRRDDITDETLARVIICFCNGDQIRELKNYLKRIQKVLKNEIKPRKFVIVAGSTDESWRERVIWEPKVADLFYVTPRVGYVKEFHDHYASLSTKNITEYPYLEKFRQRYSRIFSSMADSNETFDGTHIYEKTYKNSSRALNVMKSVFLVAHNTPNSRPKLDFPIAFFGEELEFDGFRLPNDENFEVHKYQETSNVASHNFIKVAEYLRRGWEFLSEDWNDTETGWEPNIIPLFINKEHFQYSTDEVKSHCSEPCSPGYKKNFEKDRCCWTCTSCDILERTNPNQTSCIKCGVDEVPDENQNKTHCVSMSTRIQEPTEWYNWQNMICMCFSSSSIILTIIVSIIFIKQRNTPVVKSTTKELCYVMFAGIALANITIFISVLSGKFKTPAVKVLPAIGFTTIYAALLMKTIRIARILSKSENSFPRINLKFVSITAQIITTVALIGVESLICWHAVQANDTYLSTEKIALNYVLKTYYLNGCFLMRIFGFVGMLILFCMYFAIESRNLPGNYNETKHIALSMFTTIVIAMFFCFMYLISEYKILLVNSAISINSLSVLVFLFLPKLNIILRRPERNTKAYYTTIALNIRKHVREEPHQQQQ